TPVNDAPVAVADSITVAEGGTATVLVGGAGSVLSNDSDAEQNSLSAILVTGPAHGSLTLNADGTFSYVHDGSETTADSFSYKVNDGTADGNTVTVNITVSPVNDTPDIDNSLVSVAEDIPSGTTLVNINDRFTGTDLDRDGQQINYQITAGNEAGLFTINSSTGVITLAAGQHLDYETVPQHVLTVTASDGSLSDTATVTINVGNINDNAPNVLDSSVTVAESTAAGTVLVNVNDSYTLNDTDRDGQAIRYQITGGNAAGLFVIDSATGAISLATGQHLDYETAQQHQLTVSATDGTRSDTATVTINVGDSNDNAPTSSNTILDLVEDLGNTSSAYALGLANFGVFQDQDAGNSLQAVRIDALPGNGTLYLDGVAITTSMVSSGGLVVSAADISAGKLTFDPTDHSDVDSAVTFHVSDGTNWSSQSYTTTINLEAVADKPTLSVSISSVTTGGGLAPDETQKGNGLTLNYYDNVAGLNTGNASSTTRVESVLESTTPTSQTVATNLGTRLDVPEDDAYSANGLIYLEAGHTYTFTGYHDDTLRLEIGGTAIIAVGYNHWGNYTASYVPAVSGYYSFEMFAYNGNNVGAISVMVSVDSGAAVDLSTSNIPLYTDISQVDALGLQHAGMTSVGDGGYYASTYNHGMVGTTIHLASISATTADTDGSETLTLVVSALPEGSVLSDGTHTFVATTADSAVDITQWDGSALLFTPPLGFTGTVDMVVTATTTEAANGSQSSTQSTLTVTVDADSIQTLNASYTAVATSAMGLSGEYYGYNDSASPGNNYQKESGDGSVGNLDSVSDASRIIFTRTGITIGASNPVAASDSSMDARFVATSLNYGSVTSGNLGASAQTLYYKNVTSGNLYNFLHNSGNGHDASSLYATNNYGNTTDAIIRILGSVYFGEGSYQFKVTADDGYKVYIDGVEVVTYDGNVATATTTGASVSLSEGLHQVEIVYWDQGGAANFSMSYKETADSSWSQFNSSNLLMLQEGYTLSDLQDVVQDSTGTWMIRTGESVTGTTGQDLITGSEGRDIIHGAAGNDVLQGGGAADQLYGDLGNDILVGGEGSDTLTGGGGKDIFSWQQGDQGSALTLATDHITDFDKSADVIDISDLLDHGGDKSADVLKSYLSIGADNNNVTIEIHDPEGTGAAGAVVEKIVLDNVSFSDITGSSSSTADQVLNYMLNNGLLDIDK
ncbi:cadherin domain-containing protein, partial [Pseudaeromonas sharmana]